MAGVRALKVDPQRYNIGTGKIEQPENRSKPKWFNELSLTLYLTNRVQHQSLLRLAMSRGFLEQS